MDPSTLALLLGGIGSVGGGLAGAISGGQDRAKAQQLLQQMLQQYQGLSAPTADQLRLGPSAMQGITDNPALLSDQTGALGALQGVSDAGGLNLNDRAALQQIMGRIGQETTARNAGAVDQAASRGQAGSGDMLAAALSNNASAEQGANQVGTDIAGKAQARALQAMLQRGQLAGQIRGQDFGENAAKAQAADAIARYNAQVPMEAYGAQLQKLQGEQGAMGPLESYYMGDAQRQQQMYGGVGQGLGELGMAGALGYGKSGSGSTGSYTDPSQMVPQYQDPSASYDTDWKNPYA